MKKKWKMPNWMKKYRRFFIYDTDFSIEHWMNLEGLIFLEKPREFVQSVKVRVQVNLLEELYKKGFLNERMGTKERV